MVSQKIHKVCMLYLRKHFRIFFLLFLAFNCNGQQVVQLFHADSTLLYRFDENEIINKSITDQFSVQIHLALQYFPELSHTHIQFKIKRQFAPLAARPRFWAIFQRPKKRKYLITISSGTSEKLEPILFNKLTFNAQIGVLGHELSHVSHYQSKKGVFFIRLFFMHLSKKKMDAFEFATDKRCIEHLLGYQLMSWSREVREKLKLLQWGGANNPKAWNERYMNPETIQKYIDLYYK